MNIEHHNKQYKSCEIPIAERIGKYSFNHEINEKLKGFKTYLQELGNGKEAIRQKSNYAGYFLNWLETEN